MKLFRDFRKSSLEIWNLEFDILFCRLSSVVERTLHTRDVASSNLAVGTLYFQRFRGFMRMPLFLLHLHSDQKRDGFSKDKIIYYLSDSVKLRGAGKNQRENFMK